MKENLFKVLKNPANKLIAVDLDQTLSEGEWWIGNIEPKPMQKNIDFINSLYKKGGHIVIYTARNPDSCRMTIAWLLKYGVEYHGIVFQKKCGADIYIDDKALNIEDVI